MDCVQRPIGSLLILGFAACYFAASFGLVIVATSVSFFTPIKTDYRVELKGSEPTRFTSGNTLEALFGQHYPPNYGNELSPSVREYISALRYDEKTAQALLKHMSPIDLGYAAFERRDYTKAMQMWLPQARQGNAEAQARVADLYDQGGSGVARNEYAAREWYSQCAVQDDLNCQVALARSLRANGTSKDQRGAYMWFSVFLMSAMVAKSDYWPIREILAERVSLSRKMDAPDVARARRLALRCYLSHLRHCGS